MITRRQFDLGALACLAAPALGGRTAPEIESVEPLGMLVKECALPGETRADESQSEPGAVRVDCPSESADEDCVADKVAVPATPAAAPDRPRKRAAGRPSS